MVYETPQTRSAYKTPSHEDAGQNLPVDRRHRVHLRHPGYADGNNILLTLSALDHPEGGIHHETARIACAIIANNSWEGYLTESRASAPVQAGPDGILRRTDYYFRVSSNDPDEKYAIVPSFAHWHFPHNHLPQSWTLCEPPEVPVDRQMPRQSTLTAGTLTRDVTCRITNCVEGTEHAHLVPRSEESWFDKNTMFRCIDPNSRLPIDDPQNALLLRSDMHSMFDQKRFVIVPKRSTFLVHVINPGRSRELVNLYHNTSLQPLSDVSIECLLARFAWTIFAQSAIFLRQGQIRKLQVRTDNGETSTSSFSGEECLQLIPGPKSRSQSPRKRQRDVPPAEDENNNKETVRRRTKWRSLDAASKADAIFDKQFWTTSEDTDSDTWYESDSDEYDDGITRSRKRQCLGSPLLDA